MTTRRTATVLLGLATAASTTLLTAPVAVAAGETGLPEMCSGRSDPSMTLNAHAYGDPKFVLNLETDPTGAPTGVLILGKGADRVYVDDLCRFWQHLPGQVPEGGGHEGEEMDETATTAHAVGLGTLADGTRVLVRSDVRENDEGTFFRVRYRVMGMHGGEETVSTTAEEGHDEESWVRIPLEGWAPLDLMNLR